MTEFEGSKTPDHIWLWKLGQVAQGLVMGVLLVVSIVKLFGLASGATTFVYQGY